MKGMSRVTVKGLIAHKLRLALTALSVVLGVAFVSGTFVLTDTINHTFDELFSEVSAGVDVTLRAKSGFGEAETGADTARNTLPEDLVDTVKAVPGVKVAEGTVSGYAQIVTPAGKAITTSGAPTLGFNWNTSPDLSALKLRTGRAPERDGEVVVDVNTAKENALEVGQQVKVLFRTGTDQFTIVGLTGFGRADNLAGATIAAFDFRTAQRVLGKVGQVDTVDAAATADVNALGLRDRIEEAVPPSAEAVTSGQVVEEASKAVKDGLSFFGKFLLTFAGISLFVGSFIIFNTFSILVAQRSRELALLRALGASRAQVLRSVLGEALIVGVVSSAVGLGLGVLFAIGLKALLDTFGIDLPSTSMQFLPRTVIASFVVGVAVTLAAAVAPARRASKVAPIAALRESADEGGSLRNHATVGAVATGLGALVLANGLFGNDDNPLLKVGIGAGLTFLGVAVLSPFVARPLASAIGSPLTRRRRMAPRLGRENAMRNPRRTAAASAALMIGLGMVGTVTVLASSVKESTTRVVDRSLAADYALSTEQSMAAISPTLADDMARRPELAAVTELAAGEWRLNGTRKGVYGATAATVDETLNVQMSSGDLSSLDRGELLVEDSVAKENRWTVGTVLPMTFARTGTQDVRIGGTFERNQLLGSYAISLEQFDANYTDRLDFVVLAKTAPGVSDDAARAAIAEVAADYPNVKVQDQARVKAENRKQVDQLLSLVGALLMLAIIIALFGIVNTLVLSVLERTRELGLLRAVGMTRRQVRTMVRTESIITSVMGAVLGLSIGVLFGVAIQKALESEGVDSLVIPYGSLVTYVIAAGLAGVLAAVGPARKAAKLDVLRAISYE